MKTDVAETLPCSGPTRSKKAYRAELIDRARLELRARKDWSWSTETEKIERVNERLRCRGLPLLNERERAYVADPRHDAPPPAEQDDLLRRLEQGGSVEDGPGIPL